MINRWTVIDTDGMKIVADFPTEEEAVSYLDTLPDQNRVYAGDYHIDPPDGMEG